GAPLRREQRTTRIAELVREPDAAEATPERSERRLRKSEIDAVEPARPRLEQAFRDARERTDAAALFVDDARVRPEQQASARPLHRVRATVDEHRYRRRARERV